MSKTFKLFYCILTLILLHTSSLHAQKHSYQSYAMTLVLDPGHGGRDPGAEHRQTNCMDEKVLNLRIALKLGKLLEDYFENLRLIYTRKKDVYVSLQDRVTLAEKHKADCFISLHINANKKTEVFGVQVHIHNKGIKSTDRLSRLIQQELKLRAKRHSLGVFTYHDRKGHLYVLRETTMPCVLVECGFLSHKKEEKFLNTDHGQDIIASAIFRAFRKYAKEMSYGLRRHPITVYKVQIAASADQIPKNAKMFKKVDMKIDEHKIYTDSKFPYKYTVGRALKQEKILPLVKELQQKGIPEAFVVKHREYPK